MKTITSPVKKWPGTIVLPDYLNMTQAIAWEDALDSAQALLPKIEFTFKEDGTLDDSPATDEQRKYLTIVKRSKYANEMIPGIKACVLEWHLENFDPENWPATPRQSREDLVNWIGSEITNLYKEADEVPNE